MKLEYSELSLNFYVKMIFEANKNINRLNKKGSKIIIIIIFISLFMYFVILKHHIKIHVLQPLYKKIEDFEDSCSNSFLYTFFIENEITKIKKFWKINENDKLIDDANTISYKRKESPKISVIITVYNQINCFYKALKSIQNQSLQNIEIIIIDDGSTDNSVKLIEKYQKDDNRIILLKHEFNLGKIKSRSDGVKLAKGEYLLVIDGDDGLATKDILYNCYSIAKIGNLDIVEFKKAYFLNRFYKKIENNLDPIDNLNNRIIYQPELKFKFVKITENKEKFSYLNRNVCSKLIRNEIFKQVLEFIGPKYTEDYMLVFEDTIMSVSLFILSNSYYLMRDPGYYRSKGECQESISKNVKKKCGYKGCTINPELDSFKYLNFLIEKLNTSLIEGQMIYYEFSSIIYIFDLHKKINNDFNYVYKVLDLLFFKFNFDNKEPKDRIIKFKNFLRQKEKNNI